VRVPDAIAILLVPSFFPSFLPSFLPGVLFDAFVQRRPSTIVDGVQRHHLTDCPERTRRWQICLWRICFWGKLLRQPGAACEAAETCSLKMRGDEPHGWPAFPETRKRLSVMEM